MELIATRILESPLELIVELVSRISHFNRLEATIIGSSNPFHYTPSPTLEGFRSDLQQANLATRGTTLQLRWDTCKIALPTCARVEIRA